MESFDLVAMGGTFDAIHSGHMALLNKAFSISSKVIIGLSSDQLATKKGKNPVNDYSKRLSLLKSVIEKNFPNSSYEVSKLENDFGPAVIEGSVKALVVSEETSNKGLRLNELRAERNLPSVKIVVVPMVLAKDGKAISTTRIRNSEIDDSGNLN
jgi:pantetheine-phosphate adenylyltransferase|uniref:Phosphopantetheine adenylyltransferase n=1 Tax=uncultured marine crenarchaeote HF4000_APKG4H17 TaxID=455589 RepID=B3T805_9ARCH|nr:putative cytidylyltransferase [uncultured marine crenarchaeote HF4000_APKG4H17]|tara:strand:- start:143 stop:607 length:465 start_codon:yes stop_codon:yes gene_type:complete